jgi:hypothetical protein
MKWAVFALLIGLGCSKRQAVPGNDAEVADAGAADFGAADFAFASGVDSGPADLSSPPPPPSLPVLILGGRWYQLGTTDDGKLLAAQDVNLD